jgi:hypothetical protein
MTLYVIGSFFSALAARDRVNTDSSVAPQIPLCQRMLGLNQGLLLRH